MFPLPGAGGGVCSSPPLAGLFARVVYPVTGQQGEDEVGGLGTKLYLALSPRLPHLLLKQLIIQPLGRGGGREGEGEENEGEG